jgi:hypothetical protein
MRDEEVEASMHRDGKACKEAWLKAHPGEKEIFSPDEWEYYERRKQEFDTPMSERFPRAANIFFVLATICALLVALIIVLMGSWGFAQLVKP